MAEQGITIVVPTLNRGGFLADCLMDLLAQNYRPIEILVVDQSKEVPEEVSRMAAEHPAEISYRRVGFRGLPEARNYGWQHARYDAVLYVDDDIRCGPDLASEHLRALSIPGVGIVGGGIDEANKPLDAGPPTGQFNPWTASASRGFAAQGEEEVQHAPGGNFSVWRRVFEAVGGFDEALNVGAALYEELEFCLRARAAGFRVCFNGRARLTHLAAPSGGCRVGEVSRYVWALAHNRSIIIRRHVGWLRAPVAVARLGLLGLSYAVHYGSPGTPISCLTGCLSGLIGGGRSPKCTRYG